MNNNVVNYSEYKRKFNTQVIYIGDFVEWQDYNGDLYESLVLKIEHKTVDGIKLNGQVDSLPLWEKDEYVVYLGEGQSIVGDIIVRKIIKRTKDKIKNNKGFKYAN